MSDLRVTREVLAPAQSPLPVSSYFDRAIFGIAAQTNHGRNIQIEFPKSLGQSIC